jgi:hypothetical protein
MSFLEPLASVLFVHRRKGMKKTSRSFVGMDVHKETISISVAEDGRIVCERCKDRGAKINGRLGERSTVSQM